MPENFIKIPSFAKINLHLRVLGKRSDGFHEICTVFQTVSLCDYLTFSNNGELSLTCDDENIPCDESNLIVKAAIKLQEKFDIKDGAKIHLEKRIPAPGGLGGGSSNAAAALIGLTELWKIKASFAELYKIGKNLGSDVPFFLYGGTAIGQGRGTEIYITDDFAEKNILIVTPKINISTALAFAHLNAEDLTNKSSKSILQICRDEVNSLYLRQSKLENDFERVIFEIEPEIAKAKAKLLSFGAERALLSGSGASIFAFFETSEQRQKAFSLLQIETDWRLFPAETISHLAYQKHLRIDKIFV